MPISARAEAKISPQSRHSRSATSVPAGRTRACGPTGTSRALRYLIFGLALVAGWYHQHLDRHLQEHWTWLREQAWFAHDTFEPAVATASLLFWLLPWYLVDTRCRTWARRYAVQPESDDMRQWEV